MDLSVASRTSTTLSSNGNYFTTILPNTNSGGGDTPISAHQQPQLILNSSPALINSIMGNNANSSNVIGNGNFNIKSLNSSGNNISVNNTNSNNILGRISAAILRQQQQQQQQQNLSNNFLRTIYQQKQRNLLQNNVSNSSSSNSSFPLSGVHNSSGDNVDNNISSSSPSSSTLSSSSSPTLVTGGIRNGAGIPSQSIAATVLNRRRDGNNNINGVSVNTDSGSVLVIGVDHHQRNRPPQEYFAAAVNARVFQNNSSSNNSAGNSNAAPTNNINNNNSDSDNNNIANGNSRESRNENPPTGTADSSEKDLLSSSSPLLGNRYLLLNQISGSSFYECLDVQTGNALACKAIGSSYSKILSAYFRLDGVEHIKPLHRILKSSDQTYLLLSFSQFGDLHSYVRERKRLKESEARQLFKQICECVKSCHQQGIVLRDLKLRKFVFSNRERTHLQFESMEDAVVLEDPDDDILKEKIGCPAYVAPEILKPHSDFSGKSADLWSLGVILYTMLVGRYPFNDPEHSSLFAKIARCHFVIPDYVSSKARCLIKSLLQKVPKHRITSEDVLYHPWLQEDPTSFQLSELSADDQCVPEIDCLGFT